MFGISLLELIVIIILLIVFIKPEEYIKIYIFNDNYSENFTKLIR